MDIAYLHLSSKKISCKESAVEGTAGISTCPVDVVCWGVSNVAHPSFLGTDNSSDFSFGIAADGCWDRSIKSTDKDWNAFTGWSSLKEGIADKADDWNRSTDEAWEGAAGNWKRSIDEADEENGLGATGASERSELTVLPRSDGCGVQDTLFWWGPEAWNGSEKKSTKPPEL